MKFICGAILFFAAACGSSTGPAGSVTISRLTGDSQQSAAGTLLPTPLSILIRNESGAPMVDTPVIFTIVAGGGATSDTLVRTNSGGIAATEWYLGPAANVVNRLKASYGNTSVEFTADASVPAVGGSYFGFEQYIEYLPGDLPIIISAPHGGGLEPATIPDRIGTNIETVRDSRTEELAREIRDAFYAQTGHRPHVIICRLRRTKLDANREIVEAALGNRTAQRAWYEFHAFITAARWRVSSTYARGLYMDLHGHGHAIQRLELGYLITTSQLMLNDATLNSGSYASLSSIRELVQSSGSSLSQLIRGSNSLGNLFELEGYPAVPSVNQADPGAGNDYFNGGYNTARHGSRDGGTISGFQLETNNTGVRDTPANRLLFATALVDVFDAFIAAHMGMDIKP